MLEIGRYDRFSCFCVVRERTDIWGKIVQKVPTVEGVVFDGIPVGRASVAATEIGEVRSASARAVGSIRIPPGDGDVATWWTPQHAVSLTLK